MWLALLATMFLQTPPPRQLTQEQAQKALMAIETGTAKLAVESAAAPVVPISLDRDGSGRHGFVLDRYLMMVADARVALREDKSPAGATAPDRGAASRAVAVIGFPAKCDGRSVPADSIDLSLATGPMPGPVRKVTDLLTGDQVTQRFPGFTLPAGAVAQLFVNVPLSSATATIAFNPSMCTGADASLSFVFQTTGARLMTGVNTVKLPQDAQAIPWPVSVRVQTMLDATGTPRFPTAIDGPPELEAAAAEAAARWKFQPFQINGVPIAQPVSLNISFIGDGAPTATTPKPSDGPTPLTSLTVGGRLPEGATADVPGLTPATSKCPIAEDATYGMGAATPIKVGGDAFNGPARERAYLNALRGPAGQAIRYRRLGSTKAPDQTILDMYEVTYTGLEKALRLYVDEYHFEELKAPVGFACPAPFPIQKVNDIR